MASEQKGREHFIDEKGKVPSLAGWQGKVDLTRSAEKVSIIGSQRAMQANKSYEDFDDSSSHPADVKEKVTASFGNQFSKSREFLRKGTLQELDSIAQREATGSRERLDSKNQDLIEELDNSKSMNVKTPTEYQVADNESRFSGVIDTTDPRDELYKGVEISTRTIKNIRPYNERNNMEALSSYDATKTFEAEFDGTFVNLDRDKEREANFKEADKIVQEVLQPRAVRKVPAKTTPMKKQIVTGKRLPRFDEVSPGKTTGQKEFFASLFQTIGQLGGDAEPGKIRELNPLQADLDLVAVAKSQAISQENWSKFESIFRELVKKHELDLKDAVDDMTYQEFVGDDAESEDDFNVQLDDIWEDFESTVLKQDRMPSGRVPEQVNKKLRDYLKQNSEFLSGPVNRYLQRVEDGLPVDEEQRISHLGLLTYERQAFLDKLHKVKLGFDVQVNNLKIKAAAKAKKLAVTITEDLKKLFIGEYHVLVEQVNMMRYQMAKLENRLQSSQRLTEVLEELNVEKDTFYDHLPIRFIDLCEDIEFKQPEDLPPLTADDVIGNHALLNQVFQFYGSYAQLSMNAKDQIGESIILKQFITKIKDLQEEIAARDELQISYDKMVGKEAKASANDLEVIYDLQAQVKKLKKELKGAEKRHTDVKRRLYNDFQKENKKLRKQFEQFRVLTENEIKIKDSILEMTSTSHEKIHTELKTLKTVLAVPRLRSELKNYEIKGANFDTFLEHLNDLNYTVKKQLAEAKIIKVSKQMKQEEMERAQKEMTKERDIGVSDEEAEPTASRRAITISQRQKFRMNQTFNISQTHTSIGLPPVAGAELQSVIEPNTDEEDDGQTTQRKRLLIMGQTGVTFNAGRTGEADGFENSEGQGDDTAEDLYMQPTHSSAIRQGFALLSKETMERERENHEAARVKMGVDEQEERRQRLIDSETLASSKPGGVLAARRTTYQGFGSGQISLLSTSNKEQERLTTFYHGGRNSEQRMHKTGAVLTSRRDSNHHGFHSGTKAIRLQTHSDLAKTLQTLTTSPNTRHQSVTRRINQGSGGILSTSPHKKKHVAKSPKKEPKLTQRPSVNFFRASSIGSIYHEQVKINVQGESDKKLPELGKAANGGLINSHTTTQRSFIFDRPCDSSVERLDAKPPTIMSTTKHRRGNTDLLPKMSDELKRNLNRHFGLTISGVNGNQQSTQAPHHQQVIGGVIHRLDTIGTQGSQHNLGFTIGHPSQISHQASLDSQFTSRQNLGLISQRNANKSMTGAKVNQNYLSRANINVNIQSGASLAMRGHFPHNQGGLILEGKFMDIGGSNTLINSPMHEGNRDIEPVYREQHDETDEIRDANGP